MTTTDDSQSSPSQGDEQLGNEHAEVATATPGADSAGTATSAAEETTPVMGPSPSVFSDHGPPSSPNVVAERAYDEGYEQARNEFAHAKEADRKAAYEEGLRQGMAIANSIPQDGGSAPADPGSDASVQIDPLEVRDIWVLAGKCFNWPFGLHLGTTDGDNCVVVWSFAGATVMNLRADFSGDAVDNTESATLTGKLLERFPFELRARKPSKGRLNFRLSFGKHVVVDFQVDEIFSS